MQPHIIHRIRQYVASSSRFKVPLELLLIVALLSLRSFDLDADVLPVHHAHDVR